MNSEDRHLDEEMIFKAIIDESDLTPGSRSHLMGCESCRLKKEAIEADFSHFTSLVQKASPEPRRPVNLDLNAGRAVSFRWASPVFAALLVIMITLAGLSFLIPGSKNKVKETVFTVARLESEREANRQLVAEVMALEENIMPEIYSVLAGDTDSDRYDEFIDFVFPMEEETNGV